VLFSQAEAIQEIIQRLRTWNLVVARTVGEAMQPVVEHWALGFS
jgi:hypothetical protein